MREFLCYLQRAGEGSVDWNLHINESHLNCNQE